MADINISILTWLTANYCTVRCKIDHRNNYV